MKQMDSTNRQLAAPTQQKAQQRPIVPDAIFHLELLKAILNRLLILAYGVSLMVPQQLLLMVTHLSLLAGNNHTSLKQLSGSNMFFLFSCNVNICDANSNTVISYVTINGYTALYNYFCSTRLIL